MNKYAIEALRSTRASDSLLSKPRPPYPIFWKPRRFGQGLALTGAGGAS